MIAALADAGFDIQHAFDARALAAEFPWLPGPCGILIGNSRALWPPFVAGRPPGPDPLERYVEAEVARAFPGAPVFYSHRRHGGAFLPFQKLAVAAGLAASAPTGLVVHPTFGPWFALRAVVLVDGEPIARAPIAKPCACDGRCEDALASALQGGDWRAWLAVRDACAIREHRYSDAQIRYHYTRTWD